MLIKKSKYIPIGLLVLSGFEALICGIYLMVIPTDTKNAFFAGYSTARLSLMVFFLAVFICSLILARLVHSNYPIVLDMAKKIDQYDISIVLIQFVLFVVSIFGSTIAFQAPENFGRYTSIFTRLQPFMIWLTLSSVEFGIFWLANFHVSITRALLNLSNWIIHQCRIFIILILDVARNLICPDTVMRRSGLNWMAVLAIWVFFPVMLGVLLFFTSAVPMLYMMIYIMYFILAGLAIRSLKNKTSLIAISIFFILVTCSRLFSQTQALNAKDLTVFSIYEVKAGNSIEQDFYLTNINHKIDALLVQDDNIVIFRFLGNVDLENTELCINGHNIGRLQDLLYREPQTPFSGNEVNNYFFIVPADLLLNQSLITVRIVSTEDYQIGYSSGIHPLPESTHARLIDSLDDIIDLSDQYENGRFRFQMAFYIISNRYQTEDHYPLILGTIL